VGLNHRWAGLERKAGRDSASLPGAVNSVKTRGEQGGAGSRVKDEIDGWREDYGKFDFPGRLAGGDEADAGFDEVVPFRDLHHSRAKIPL
jgi:hypothetical protein